MTATVQLDDGREGVGYTYTGGKGRFAIAAMLEHDFAPMLLGQDAEAIDVFHDAMQWYVHYVARGGIASFAVSAIDNRENTLLQRTR